MLYLHRELSTREVIRYPEPLGYMRPSAHSLIKSQNISIIYGTYTDADSDKYVGEQWESRITAQPFTDAAAAVGERLS